MRSQQIPLSWASRQAAFAVAAGLSLETIFDRALIVPRFGDERDRITPLQLTLFQAVIVLETNDGSHSMVRHRLDPETGPMAFRILFGGANLDDGLTALCKFYEMSSRSFRYRLSTEGADAFLALQVEDDRDGGPLQEDIQLLYLYLGLTHFLGRPFPVSRVTTRDTRHVNLGGIHYATGSPVRLGSCAGLSFPKALLASLPPKAKTDDFTWSPMQSALRIIDEPITLLHQGVTNLDLRAPRLAADLSIAPSTWRRRLARDGSSFRQQREDMLLEAALDLLKNRSWSVEAIASELGYADSRSFRRFVKRATGQTPNELRDHPGAVPHAQVYARFKEVMLSMRR